MAMAGAVRALLRAAQASLAAGAAPLPPRAGRAGPHLAPAARCRLLAGGPARPREGPDRAAAEPETWVDAMPAAAVPYLKLARVHRAMPIALLAYPCFWSIGLAAPPGSPPDAGALALFGAGAVLLRGAGCTVNDLWDRDLDARVARTRGRPLAAGAVSPPQALAFLGAQLGLGLGVLLQLNPYSQVLGASSLALVGAYPLMKRVTDWPQAFLGLTINWGALLGYSAVAGACDWGVVLPLYLSGVCWTLVYDTIYAHQDKADDAKVGVRSTALLFGDRTRPVLSAFAVGAGGGLALSGLAAGCHGPFFVGAGAGVAHLLRQIWTVDLEDPADCGRTFASNGTYGALVFAGVVADRLLA